jgi:hypothetical protein
MQATVLSRYQATPKACVFMAFLFLCLAAHVLWDARREHRAGIPVTIGNVVRFGIWCLLLAGVALYDAIYQ